VITYTPCRCGCRPDGAPEPCACRECGPGPGHDYLAKHGKRAKAHNARLMFLLHKDPLTAMEEAELDRLLAWYVHKSD